jgi:hypothetical protein
MIQHVDYIFPYTYDIIKSKDYSRGAKMTIVIENLHLEKARATVALWQQHPNLMPQIADTFECHIFVGPIDPTATQQQAFINACQTTGLRALNLGLNFVNSGMHAVLQSTKYYKVKSPLVALMHMIEDAEKIAEHCEVVRIKLESLAINDGIPQTDAEACAMPGDTYFEYHIKLKDMEINEQNDEILKQLSAKLTKELGIAVPFSCNNLPHFQRFLNARTYRLGFTNSYALIEKIICEINKNGFTIDRVVSEFIPYDTNKQLDRGWLEFEQNL